MPQSLLGRLWRALERFFDPIAPDDARALELTDDEREDLMARGW